MTIRRILAIAILVLGFHAQRVVAGVFTELFVEKGIDQGSFAMSPPAPMEALIPGTLVTYALLGHNIGELAALDETIVDTLPSAEVFVSAVASPGATLNTPAVGTNGPVTAVWDAAGGTPGGLTPVDVDRAVTIVARICAEATCTDAANDAEVSAKNAFSDALTVTNPLFPESDLRIEKIPSTEEVNAGQSLTYTLNVSNAGRSNSATTRVIDTLPEGFAAIDVQSTIPGASCSIGVGGQTVACTFALGTANQCKTSVPTSGTITIDVTVAPNAPAGVYTNTATIRIVGDCGYDPTPSNNIATADVRVLGRGAPALSPVGLAALAILLGIGGTLVLRRRVQQ